MAGQRTPGRPVEVDPDEIALIAVRLFADRGVDDVTMSEVAEAAGVSRRTLFRWFPSKAALIWGGTIEADDRFEAAWLAADRAGGLLDRVRAAYAASIAPLGEHADITRLRLRLIDDNAAVYAWGHELRARTSERLTKHVADAIDAPPDSVRVASLVAALGAASYAALVWWARHDAADEPAAVLDEALAELAAVLDPAR